MKKWSRRHCRRLWTQTSLPSSSSQSNRSSPGNLTVWRFTVTPSTCPSRLVIMGSVTTRPLLHTIRPIGCVWTQKSWRVAQSSTHLLLTRWWLQWLKNSPSRMNAWNFSGRSWPLFRRLKFPRFRQALRPRQTCSYCVETLFSRTSIYSPKFLLLCGRHRFRGIMWWVPNQRSFRIVFVPSDKPTWWLAHLWRSSRSSENPSPARKWRHPRRRLQNLQCLTAWGPRPPRRGLWHRSRPFELAPEEPVHDPSKEARSLARLLQLPQPDNVDGSQVEARLADFAPHWRSLLGNCWATGIVEDGVGIAFQQRPQLTHQSISFRTRNSRQDLQQAVDALLMKGAIERVTNVKSLGFHSQLFLVPKKTGDLRPVIDLSTLNRHMVVPHFKMETQGSIRSAIRSQEWTVSIDIRDAYLHVPMHQAVRKYLRFVVNKKVYQFTCLPFGLVTSPREFTKLLRPVVSLLRQQGVKLHVYLDDWLIRADSPEQAQLHALTTIRVPQFLGWIINFEKSDLTPSQDFQFIGMQFNTRRFTVAPLPKMHLKVQSVHQHWIANPNITARDLHRLLGMLVFMASLVRRGRLHLNPVRWWAATAWCQRTGNWSDQIQVPQWVLSEVAWWSSPAVLQGLPLVTKETEVTLFTDASSSGLGAQLGSRSTQGQWSASQRSCHINVLEMKAVIYVIYERLPTSAEVPSGEIDVRQRSDGGVHQEQGGHEIAHFDADDHSAAQVVRQQGDHVGSRPSARSAQHPGGFPVQSRTDSDHGVDDGHRESTTCARQVGRAMDRFVCDIRQQTTRQVRIAVSGPQGGVDRCHVHALGQGEGPLVRVSAIQDGPASTAEDRSVTRSGGDIAVSAKYGSETSDICLTMLCNLL